MRTKRIFQPMLFVVGIKMAACRHKIGRRAATGLMKMDCVNPRPESLSLERNTDPLFCFGKNGFAELFTLSINERHNKSLTWISFRARLMPPMGFIDQNGEGQKDTKQIEKFAGIHLDQPPALIMCSFGLSTRRCRGHTHRSGMCRWKCSRGKM